MAEIAPMILVYDTETTGLPRDWNAPLTDGENWPRLVQLAWQLHTPEGKLVSRGNRIVRPDGFTIPFNAAKVHGITTDRAEAEGIDLDSVLEEFGRDLDRADFVMGHNISFDVSIMGAEWIRRGASAERVTNKALIDSKDEATEFCAIPGGRGGKFKWPTLTELHQKLFGTGFGDAHDAAYDVDATAKCFFALVQHGRHPAGWAFLKGEGGSATRRPNWRPPTLPISPAAIRPPPNPVNRHRAVSL